MMLARRNNQYSLWDEFFKDPLFGNSFGMSSSSLMQTDVVEHDNNYRLSMELPGYAKEDIHAELKDGYLTISAEHNECKDEKDDKGSYIRRERYSGACRRSFYVGEDIRQEDIEASFRDGVLQLSIPKSQPQAVSRSPQYIAIE